MELQTLSKHVSQTQPCICTWSDKLVVLRGMFIQKWTKFIYILNYSVLSGLNCSFNMDLLNAPFLTLLGLQIFVYLDFQWRNRNLFKFLNNLCFKKEPHFNRFGGWMLTVHIKFCQALFQVNQIICSVTSFSSIPDYLQLHGLSQPDNTGEDMR